MTLISDLAVYGTIQVGTSATLGAVYSLVGGRWSDSAAATTPELVSGLGGGAPSVAAHAKGGVREISWQVRVHTQASSDANIPAHKEAVLADLARNGERVQLIEYGPAGGVTRTLPAGGVAAGSLPGYPRVSVRLARQNGPVCEWDVDCVTRIPTPLEDEIPEGQQVAYGLVQHVPQTEISISSTGASVTTYSGTVRVANTQSARDYIASAILAPIQEAAALSGTPVTVVYRCGPDASECSYTITVGAADTTLVGYFGVRAEITDRTERNREGQVERRIEGYALGGSLATAYAESQRDVLTSIGATTILVRDSIGQPRGGEGRVDFAFTALTGVTNGSFVSGAVVLSYEESYGVQGAGRPLVTAQYYDREPVLSFGSRGPAAVTQQIEISFIGASFADAEAAALLSGVTGWADNLAAPAQVRRRTRGSVRSLSVSRVYVFATTPDPLPTPREVSGL